MVDACALPNRVDDFLRAPLAALMFVMAGRADLGAEDLADPATASLLASYALAQLEPWRGDGFAAAGRAEALDAVRSVRARRLVARVLVDPRNSWWDAPLDRKNQLLLRGQDERPADPQHIPVPAGPISRWETYAQKPQHTGIMTTTELQVAPSEQIRSGGHANLACGSGGDWQPVYPVKQFRLQVAREARVFEVHSAADWHNLATRYGDPATHQGSHANLREAGGIDNGLAPTWSAVAADYDGVHLSFAGLLTSVQAPTTSDLIGTTTLWAWDWECTHWIRSVFTEIETLPALTEPPERPYPNPW